MSSLKKEELKNILPINGPSVEEVTKYIDKYNDESIVIKCGGSVLLDPNLFKIGTENLSTRGAHKNFNEYVSIIQLIKPIKLKSIPISLNQAVNVIKIST